MRFKRILVEALSVISVFGLYLVVVLGAIAGLSFLFKLMWNAWAPLIWEAAPRLTLWQALGSWMSLVMLISMLINFFTQTFRPRPRSANAALAAGPLWRVVLVVTALGVLALFSFALMGLWNWLAPVYWASSPRLGFLAVWLVWIGVAALSWSIQQLLHRGSDGRPAQEISNDSAKGVDDT